VALRDLLPNSCSSEGLRNCENPRIQRVHRSRNCRVVIITSFSMRVPVEGQSRSTNEARCYKTQDLLSSGAYIIVSGCLICNLLTLTLLRSCVGEVSGSIRRCRVDDNFHVICGARPHVLRIAHCALHLIVSMLVCLLVCYGLARCSRRLR
jgi:hypothetical protein